MRERKVMHIGHHLRTNHSGWMVANPAVLSLREIVGNTAEVF